VKLGRNGFVALDCGRLNVPDAREHVGRQAGRRRNIRRRRVGGEAGGFSEREKRDLAARLKPLRETKPPIRMPRKFPKADLERVNSPANEDEDLATE
jgi:hypothetical protein